MNYAMITVLVWNILVMFIYGVDKLLAKAHKRRISELSLITSALFMSGLGAMFGMVLFNHKTSKIKFRIFVPLAVLFEMFALYCAMKYLN